MQACSVLSTLRSPAITWQCIQGNSALQYYAAVHLFDALVYIAALYCTGTNATMSGPNQVSVFYLYL